MLRMHDRAQRSVKVKLAGQISNRLRIYLAGLADFKQDCLADFRIVLSGHAKVQQASWPLEVKAEVKKARSGKACKYRPSR